MTEAEITHAFERFLARRGVPYSASDRLVADLRMDSQDLVSLVLEFEIMLGREMDEATLATFVDLTVGEICARLAD
jgi:acyl carrier protein